MFGWTIAFALASCLMPSLRQLWLFTSRYAQGTAGIRVLINVPAEFSESLCEDCTVGPDDPLVTSLIKARQRHISQMPAHFPILRIRLTYESFWNRSERSKFLTRSPLCIFEGRDTLRILD